MIDAWDKPLRLAQKASYLQAAQEICGIGFDKEKAERLIPAIEAEMAKIEQEVLPKLPPRPLKKSEQAFFTFPKKPYRIDGSYSELMLKFAERHKMDLNPGGGAIWNGKAITIKGGETLPATMPMELGNSEDLKNWFLEQGWVPTLWNLKKDEKGKPLRDPKTKQTVRSSPKIQENGKLCPNLEELQGDLVRPIVKWLSYRNRHSVLSGWLADPRLAFDGRLTAGSSGITNTFRQRHSVVCNVPKNKPHVLLGREFRELFVAYRGQKLVGYDASSLEQRLKGHFTHKYDGGAYAAKILSPDYDDHEESAQAWGIDRSIAKNGNYALNYFCGVDKLASTIKCSKAQAQERYDIYWELNKPLKDLDEALEKHWESNGKKYIVGLDGRRVYARHRHSLVNLLIQSSGSILMDYAAMWMDWKLGGLKFDEYPYYKLDGHRASRVLYQHDEYEWSVDPEIAERVLELGKESIRRAGLKFNLRVPLLSDGSIADNWAELK